MSSQELGLGLGIGIALLVVFGALLWLAARRQILSTLQANPESGQGSPVDGNPNVPTSPLNYRNRASFWPRQHRTPVPSFSTVRRHSRLPLTDINTAQLNPAPEQPRDLSAQVQAAHISSRRTRRSTRTHPLAKLSGQEVRAMDRGRLNNLPLPPNANTAVSNPQSPRIEPPVELVEDDRWSFMATACHSNFGDLTLENQTSMSTIFIDSASDPRIPPVVPPSPERIPRISTQRDSGSGHNASIQTVSPAAEARLKQRRQEQNLSFIPHDVDEILSISHESPANHQQSDSSSDPPIPRRQRSATDGSNRRRSYTRSRAPRQRSVTFDDSRNRTFVMPPAASNSPTDLPSQQHERPTSPMPGSWPSSPTMSSLTSENEMRLRDTTSWNTAVNGARRTGF